MHSHSLVQIGKRNSGKFIQQIDPNSQLESHGHNKYQLIQPKSKVFIFGGINSLGQTTNDLYQITQQSSKALYSKEISIQGVRPKSRAKHNMHYIEHLNSIMILGGIFIETQPKHTQEILDDIYLYQIDL